jgi:hypothetical protein
VITALRELDHQPDTRHVTKLTRSVTDPARVEFALDIGAPVNIARTHLDPLAVLRLDEPSAR